MSARSSGLFHTRISALLNLHRLLPSRVIADVAGMTLPLASQEGFIRQILGWREFVRHVHLATDGFRTLPGGATADRRASRGRRLCTVGGEAVGRGPSASGQRAGGSRQRP